MKTDIYARNSIPLAKLAFVNIYKIQLRKLSEKSRHAYNETNKKLFHKLGINDVSHV